MKKNLLLFSAILVAACTAWAQSPTYFNYNTAAGANVFPFGNTSTNRVQWRIPAYALGSVGPGNNITVVYFQTSNGNTNTYPTLNIKLKQTVNGFSGGGLFETGMTTVFTGNNIQVTGVPGGWISFTLQTPFLYDPSMPLLVEAEQNATSGIGPYIYQTSPTGAPGNGRQYGVWGNTNYNGADQTNVHFGIDVVPNTPCSSTPGPNTVVPASYTTCPNLSNPFLGVASNYTVGGITYQWYSSTTSSVGPFTAIPNATMSTAPMGTLSSTTWFQAVATCTNTGGSVTMTPNHVLVEGPTVGTAPYYESFENILALNRLPNCSWAADNLGSNALTYTSSNTAGRMPRTGQNFASFYYNPGGTRSFYTHPIWLEAGITYSASVWYITEYYGYNNWSDLSILVGPSQSAIGQQTIASTNGPAVSNVYKSLSNTFSVSTSGNYHVAIRATGSTASSAQYLSWDDLAIEIPCSLNSPTVNVTSNQSTICVNDPNGLVLQASGADTYTWSTGDQGSVATVMPAFPGMITYTVVGTSALSGCATTAVHQVVVNPAPDVQAFAIPQTVCAGSPVTLYATGAANVMWSTNATGNAIQVTPAATGTYAAVGINEYNCEGRAVANVSVNPLPTITVDHDLDICEGEQTYITASGAQHYQVIYPGGVVASNPALVKPAASTQFTIIGTDNNGCKGSTLTSIVVNACVGMKEYQAASFKFYPNPAAGRLTVEFYTGTAKSVEIFDVSGRLVASQEVSGPVVHLNIATLAPGLYTVKVTGAEGSQTGRLVKE